MGKKLSITAFVLSLLFPIPFAPFAGAVLGIIDLVRKEESSIKGLSIAAIITGLVVGFIGFLMMIGGMAYFGSLSSNALLPE